MTPGATPADDALAVELFGAIVGRPDLETMLLPRLRLGDVLRSTRRPALVVLVGPALEQDHDTLRLRVLRWAGARVVQVLGSVPATASGIRAAQAAARVADHFVCRDEQLLANAMRIVPALQAVPGYPARGTRLPDMLLDDLVAA